ncbi:hypothetical protein ACFW16_24490 [Inquilinus sp. NPDC058860]|uniref:hypothetical protein n=1 Tax=Inquilinus sp. NPDC058860 TaxID=3346652 RepID=UPI0036CCBBC1
MRFVHLTIAASLLSVPAQAEWRRLDTKDPINDKITTSIYVDSTGEAGTESNAMFGVTCNPMKQLFFVASFSRRLDPASGDTVWMLYRVDDNRAIGGNWSVRDDPVVTLPYRKNIKIDFAGGTKLVVRATGQKRGPSELTALFDISGIDQAFADIEAACAGS